MPRLPRYAAPGVPQHVIQRGNNRSAQFLHVDDYRFYLECLRTACHRYGCLIHAYALMTNHVHLLVTPASNSAISRMMQSIGRRYVQYFNKQHQRTGTLWEGRYRASLVQTDQYLFACYRYIELNPVRAGLASNPGDYPWSSHNANAFGSIDPIVSPHDGYTALAADSRDRAAAYRALFEIDLEEQTIEAIRESTDKGWVLGSRQFRDEVAKRLRRRTQPISAGRRSVKRIQVDSDPELAAE